MRDESLSVTLFPYATLFRSPARAGLRADRRDPARGGLHARSARRARRGFPQARRRRRRRRVRQPGRSEEHTSELQSHVMIVCWILLENKKIYTHNLI